MARVIKIFSLMAAIGLLSQYVAYRMTRDVVITQPRLCDYCYLGTHNTWAWRLGPLFAVGLVIIWKRSPFVRSVLPYLRDRIKHYGQGGVYVMISEEAKQWNLAPGKYKAKKVKAYNGPERRKRA